MKTPDARWLTLYVLDGLCFALAAVFWIFGEQWEFLGFYAAASFIAHGQGHDRGYNLGVDHGRALAREEVRQALRRVGIEDMSGNADSWRVIGTDGVVREAKRH